MFFEGDIADASFYKDEVLDSRLAAMLEGIDVRRARAMSAHFLGVDLGSTTAKVVILDESGDIRAAEVVQMGAVSRAGCARALETALTTAGSGARRHHRRHRHRLRPAAGPGHRPHVHRDHLPRPGRGGDVPGDPAGGRHRRAGQQGHRRRRRTASSRTSR